MLQAQAQQDADLELLDELVKAENFEQAQLEAEKLRAYYQTNNKPCPPAAVSLLSKIYTHNRDSKSAMAFFSEATGDARRDTNLINRVVLLEALVKSYTAWEAYPLALACQQTLTTAKDSLALLEQQAAVGLIQMELDSLAKIKRLENYEQAKAVRLTQEWFFVLAAGLGLVFFVLIWLNWNTAKRWRKRLDQKNLENDFLRSGRFTSTLPTEPALVNQPEQITTAHQHAAYQPDNHRPDKIALLIEPNRQIVLYLKSLLSDRFEIETAGTASEGLQVASNHLPDLIVCDAVLNGQTGIDVVRQIKLSERTSHIPVILLSERFGNEGKLDALRAGADAWFNRPVLDNEFDAQVSQLLDARRGKHEDFARFLHLYFSENRIALQDTFLNKIVQAIDQNLADPDFMADDLARKMQLHKQHFFKKLQALTGKEPIQLIREMRLEKAKSLLEKRAGTPQAIADLVGFSSAGTFALAFKEYFGESTSLLQMPDKS